MPHLDRWRRAYVRNAPESRPAFKPAMPTTGLMVRSNHLYMRADGSHIRHLGSPFINPAASPLKEAEPQVGLSGTLRSRDSKNNIDTGSPSGPVPQCHRFVGWDGHHAMTPLLPGVTQAARDALKTSIKRSLLHRAYRC